MALKRAVVVEGWSFVFRRVFVVIMGGGRSSSCRVVIRIGVQGLCRWAVPWSSSSGSVLLRRCWLLTGPCLPAMPQNHPESCSTL